MGTLAAALVNRVTLVAACLVATATLATPAVASVHLQVRRHVKNFLTSILLILTRSQEGRIFSAETTTRQITRPLLVVSEAPTTPTPLHPSEEVPPVAVSSAATRTRRLALDRLETLAGHFLEAALQTTHPPASAAAALVPPTTQVSVRLRVTRLERLARLSRHLQRRRAPLARPTRSRISSCKNPTGNGRVKNCASQTTCRADAMEMGRRAGEAPLV